MAQGRALTQALVLQMLGGNGKGNVTWSDHRTFDSRVGAEDRRAISQDTQDLLRAALGG